MTDAPTSGTAVTASGTSVDFTGIPATAKRITVMLNGVSTNGTSNNIIQIGSGSPLVTGYLSYYAIEVGGGVSSTATSTTGFGIVVGNAAENRYVLMTLVNISGNTWMAAYAGGANNAANYYGLNGGGSAALSGALDRIRITTVNGTDTFDAGTINIMYE